MAVTENPAVAGPARSPVVHDDGETARALRKTAARLLPFLCLLYFISFLDRVNVGFAALTMNADLGLSAAAYGAGTGIFFLGYFLFEVPSNLILARVGARRWISRIMVSWGALTIASAFVTGPTSFWIVRFLLGVAEAGFFPGIVLYLTYWFPASMRGRIMGWFMVALPVSSVLGAPVSTWLLDHQILGLAGWQGMFVIEGIPAILLGVVVWMMLPDGPRDARWLSAGEAAAIERAVGVDHRDGRHEHPWDAARSPQVWHLALIYFGIVTGLYGFAFWGPQIIKTLAGATNQQTGLLTMLPYALAAVAMIFWGRSSDARQERRWHLILPILLGAAGFGLASFAQGNATLGLVAFTCAMMGIYAALPIFWTRPAAILTGAGAAAGIALVNAVGNLGGYLGPAAIGFLKNAGGYTAGLGFLAAVLLAAAALAFALPDITTEESWTE
jgi:MFS transporter, ACS family, tartrate transporter